MRRGLASAATVAVLLAIGTTAPAFAKRGGGHGHGSTASDFPGSTVSSTGLPGGFSLGNKHGWNGGTTPPGWTNHGKKTGWGSGTMPPGLSGR
jgi:hypothetical protein